MGKETKEMLRTIILNQELIMKHLNISKAVASADKASDKKEPKETVKKPAAKGVAAKPGKAVKK
jgi:hypothetical protein